MAKEVIRFKGLSLHKDEQSAEHGELALCANVELHDGALRASVLEGSMVTHKDGDKDVASVLSGKLLYVHETPSYRHFICEKTGSNQVSLCWYKEDGTDDDPEHDGTPIPNFSASKIISISSVGNTLVVLTDSGVHYILWKDQGYKYLGTQIPFVDMKFRPSENLPNTYDTSTIPPEVLASYTAWRTIDLDADEVVDVMPDPDSSEEKQMIQIKGDYVSTFTDSVWALVNMANHKIAEDGRFYAPFIIRYCYRLYDGSMVMHSAPVYMNVSSPKTYRVYFYNAYLFEETYQPWYEEGDVVVDDQTIGITDGLPGSEINFEIEDKVILEYLPNNIGIKYSVANNTNLTSLKEDWSDIVKSIDIFVSPMMAREKTGERIETARQDKDSFGIRNDEIENLKSTRHAMFYKHDSSYYVYPCFAFDIPKQTDDEYLQRLKDNSTFFKLKSFDIENDTIHTNGQYEELELEKNVVLTITSQEQMKDDYHTHNDLLPIHTGDSGMYVYNHRLNLYGMGERLFKGFDISTMINELSTDPEPTDIYPEQIRIKSICIELTTEQGKKTVYSGLVDISVREYSLCNSLLFYPDSRATKMRIYFWDDNTMLTLKMEPCNFLEGAMATELFYKTELPAHTTPGTNVTGSSYMPMPNKILTSEVDDPYFFPVEGRNSVGNGKIKGVAAVTRALSQGQVGSHDLMVFSTDGIWVMKVSETGTYSAQHNISREVCSNPKSICQLDQSVIFATERSLIKHRESDLAMISEVLDGPIPKWSKVLPSLDAAFPEDSSDDQKKLIHRLLDEGTPAVQMFNEGSVFYDYASLRVVVLSKDTSKESVALVFSLRDEAWSTMAIPAIKAVVPGYPSPFVQLGEGEVMILDKPYNYDAEATATPGLIITRTLTFSDTMDVIRGYTQYADCGKNPMLYIFGSNDQRSWQSLGTSERWFYNYLPGRSFRFFRIAIYLQMKPSEEYQQLEVEVINKYAKL